MKRILVILLLSVGALAQNPGVRFGDGQPIQQIKPITGVQGNYIVSLGPAVINWCTAPANAVPCTNKATTYTDSTLGTACPANQQVILAGTTSCVGTTDSLGNWGVWAAAGQYEYTVTINGTSSGPYPATLGGSTGGGGGGGTGNVVGPNGSNAGDMATFADGTGLLLQDQGVAVTDVVRKTATGNQTIQGTNSGITGLIVKAPAGAANSLTIFRVNDNTATSVLDTQQGGLVSLGKGSTKAIGSGVAANSDLTGQLTVAAATSVSYTFTGTYSVAPICTVVPMADPTTAGVFWLTVSTTQLTINIKNNTTITFDYSCFYRT